MSVLLIGSSFVTDAADSAGGSSRTAAPANGRALAYLAHEHFGEAFGTLYDLSTIAILWFAGASAMAGLLNLVPRYLPRYGMAPEWARAMRPLVLVFTAITFLVTIIFKADVEAQGGAYATGVLVLMTSAALAVTLSRVAAAARLAALSAHHAGVRLHDHHQHHRAAGRHQDRRDLHRDDHRHVAGLARAALDRAADPGRRCSTKPRRMFIDRPRPPGRSAIIANRPDDGDVAEYAAKLREARDTHQLQAVGAGAVPRSRGRATRRSSATCSKCTGVEVGPYRVLRCKSPAVPNAIAGLLLHIRDRTGKVPHAYFGWTEGNPIAYLLKFLAFGEGDTAPVTREVLRQTEPDPDRRPRIHVG